MKLGQTTRYFPFSRIRIGTKKGTNTRFLIRKLTLDDVETSDLWARGEEDEKNTQTEEREEGTRVITLCSRGRINSLTVDDAINNKSKPMSAST